MSVIDWAILEKMAGHETGRMPLTERDKTRRVLMVFPQNLRFRRLLIDGAGENASEFYYLSFTKQGNSWINSVTAYLKFIVRLLKLLTLCSRLDLYLISGRNDRLHIITAAVPARLLGIAIDLHDYRFHSDRGHPLTRVLYPMSRSREVGDISAFIDDSEVPADLIFRCEPFGHETYCRFRKSRAVPRVLVYGNFERAQVISLINHTHNLVKQKYPRTEFVLAQLFSHHDIRIDNRDFDSSIIMSPVGSEEDLQNRFRECDIVMLLSRGGLNRLFLVRAQAAGYPAVVNGFEYRPFGRRIITVTRDSYSRLAEAVIRLVDDDDYYQSFGSE